MRGSAPSSPREWFERAIAAERGGSPQEAERIIGQAVETFPREAELHNAAANIAMRRRDFTLAAQRFAAAQNIAPAHLPYAINRAIALTEGGAPRDALRVLEQCESAGKSDPRYCSSRANAARLAGDLAQAAIWYDRALGLDSGNAKALAGRARVALERNEADALPRIDRALQREPGDAHLWLAKAQALDMTGDRQGALSLTRQIVDQAPAWRPALDLLVQLRLAAGDTDFASHFDEAARRAPQDPEIPAGHIAALAALERFDDAAECARKAQERFEGRENFVLLEATFASAAGDDVRADAAFARLQEDSIDRALHEARHGLRTQNWRMAEEALDRARAFSPFDVAAWGLIGLLWRATQDERAQWLHEQEGLVRLMPLADAEAVLPDAVALLRRVHQTTAFPHDQSLRGGTQTRGILFDRPEPELAALRQAIMQSLENFRTQLPEADPDHPLLRYRNTPWTLAGSWSVRLLGGGDHHAAHIHPLGVLSSALYLIMPQVDHAEAEAVLEIGRPPPDLRLDLPPLQRITPAEGHLALFPSTLYHGTTGFPAGERMTVAFDVVTDTQTDRTSMTG